MPAMRGNFASVKDFPSGHPLILKNRFFIIAHNATYELHGNRLKLKRAFKRFALNHPPIGPMEAVHV